VDKINKNQQKRYSNDCSSTAALEGHFSF